MNEEKLNKEGLKKVWLKFWSLVKVIVGDVDVTGKGDLQTQINKLDNDVEKCFRNASDGKNLLADAITGKGVPTKASDTFATMAENIGNIKEADDSINEESMNYRTGYNAGVTATKKGTAGTGDVLTGKTFTNASSVGASGAMANKGAVTVDAGAVTQDNTYTYLTVPANGFYNTNSKLRTQNSNLNNAIYNAIVAQGVTPASKNYADLATAIAAVKANNYNSGYNSGVATGINSMAIHAVGGANTGTFTITNYAYCAKAFLIVEVVDDDRRSFASVTVPGGTCTQIHNLEYGQHDCFTNMQVFEITGLPAGTITISCGLGYGRCAVLIGA